MIFRWYVDFIMYEIQRQFLIDVNVNREDKLKNVKIKCQNVS